MQQKHCLMKGTGGSYKSKNCGIFKKLLIQKYFPARKFTDYERKTAKPVVSTQEQVEEGSVHGEAGRDCLEEQLQPMA